MIYSQFEIINYLWHKRKTNLKKKSFVSKSRNTKQGKKTSVNNVLYYIRYSRINKYYYLFDWYILYRISKQNTKKLLDVLAGCGVK